MKKIIGKLPVNVKYNVVNIDYKPKDAIDYTICDNCGKIISNIAIMEDEDKKRFSVGLDCASTMQLYQNNEIFNLIQAKKELARRAKFVRWFNKEYKGHIIDEGNIWFYKSKVTEWQHYWIYRMNLEHFKNNYPTLKLIN